MHSDIPRFLCATRDYLTQHPGRGPHQGLTDMSWCMVAALALREVGIDVVFQAGRLRGWEKGQHHLPAQHSPFLFHCVQFHDPANPTQPVFSDLRGNEDIQSIASAAAAGFGWTLDPSAPIETMIKNLDAAAHDAFYSEPFTARLRAFLQARALEHDTSSPSHAAPRARL